MRFPEFTGEWESISLSLFGDFIGGGTPPSANTNFWEGSIPWISSSDLNESNVNRINISRYITQEALNSSATKLCEAPVILIVSRVGVGKVAYSKENICTSQDFTNIINLKSNGLFLTYLLSKIMKQKAKETQGTSIKGITSGEIKSIKINIPKDEEQEKIATFLSLIDQRIETQNKIIEELKLLKSTIRNKIFKKLRKSDFKMLEIRRLLEYEQPTKYIVKNVDYSENSTLIPVLTANKAFVLGYTDERCGIYDKGDCIIFDDFTMDMKYVDFPFKVKSSAIKILTPKSEINLRYMFEYLSFLSLSSNDHKRHYISEIEDVTISAPSIEDQNSIAKLFHAFNRKIEVESSFFILLCKQKKYLLQEMFI